VKSFKQYTLQTV